jgi:hypothetical protein
MQRENKRIADLREWPSQALQRRLQFDQDMEEALISVGAATGEFCSSLCEDVIAIKKIIRDRRRN